MAVSNLTFSAQIDALVKKTERNLTAVFRESAKRVIEEAQSRVAIDTGFLRSSLQVVLNAPVPPATRPKGTPGAPPIISAVIAGASLGDVISCGYTANYGIYVEFGTSKMAPQPFVRPAAAMWQGIVSQVVREVNARGL